MDITSKIPNTIKKLFMALIALSMFIISVGSWRYQGDIHHLHKRVFKSDKHYSKDTYQALWDKHSQGIEQKIEMKKIHLYNILYHSTPIHPSESIMNQIIDSKEWSRFIPNSKSSTYRLSQKVWMSQNLTIEELMDYALREKL